MLVTIRMAGENNNREYDGAGMQFLFVSGLLKHLTCLFSGSRWVLSKPKCL